MAAHVKVRGKWKEIKVNPNVFIEHDMSGFVCMRELTDYDVIHNSDKKSSRSPVTKNIKKTKNKKKSTQITPDDLDDVEETVHGTNKQQKKKKRKKKINKSEKNKGKKEPLNDDRPLKDVDGVEENVHVTCGMDKQQKKKKHKKKMNKSVKNKAEKQPLSGDGPLKDEECSSPAENNKPQKYKKRPANDEEDLLQVKKLKKDKSLRSKLPDMSAWKDLFVPEPVLQALAEENFTAPTPIQTLALAPAIRDRKDIVGAAETGSGKTLAFGIPLIHSILKLKEISEAETSGGEIDQSDDSAEHSDSLSDEDVTDQESPSEEEWSDLDLPSEDEDTSPEEESKPEIKVLPLYALVLTPTRELAIQVKNHIQTAARHTGIKVITIVGGMASQKQERLLKKQPEIVVATPGRLWELLQEGEAHLSKVADLRCLVIDEADRMVEKGHFEELSKLLTIINSDEAKKKRRQTFVFSATLTFVHSGPNRLKYQKKTTQMTENQKLESLMSHIGIKPKPKIIDLTRAARTAETLTEARLTCAVDEKDFYLYYFLRQYPGRTLVFANSKDCIRRLVSIFKLLQCCPLPLHADMHQRQRLKNLDRFKGNPRSLLLATDVAARGLDIPDVKHVIHYQVPRTTENYVHRSGRTARATKEGLSVMLVSPEDLQFYRKIIKSLNRDEDLPLFPVEQTLLPGVKARVNTARYIDKKEHSYSKQKHENTWYQKAAKEMDIELDEDVLLNDLGDKEEQAELKQSMEAARQELKAMLKEPLERQNYLGKYPTKSGKLQLPNYHGGSLTSAVARAKNAQKQDKKLMDEHRIKSSTKLQKKKKFKKKHKH